MHSVEGKSDAEYNILFRNSEAVRSSADNVRLRANMRHQDSLQPTVVSHRQSGSEPEESLDFEEMESIMWRKHHLRRFFQDRGHWWTASRRTTAWKWVLVILTGFLVACMGALVQVLTDKLNYAKFHTAQSYMEKREHGYAFLSFCSMCLLYAFIAGLLCWYEPAAAGSGIPEIKAYLNGVNLNKVVSLQVLYTKVLGMCLSVAAGLPLGKEGPMIHAGSIIGAAVSQGKTLTFGFDTSWTKFQDLRNDRSKRDFVTFGAAAGIAAAFKAPIGGILFTLEEGASYWSTSLTFRAFFCALVTQLTFTIIFNGFTITSTSNSGEFAFGSFETFSGYRTYELLIFTAMGMLGGLMGALFNKINEKMTLFRRNRYTNPVKKFADLLGITFGFAVICFVLPLAWEKCTPIPTATVDWTVQERRLLTQLVQFNCPAGRYNQLASLYFTGADTAMQQLYHFREVNGSDFATFDFGCLMLFFLPYFFMAAITSGTLAPAGLFVPTLLSGAAFGRIVGRILNLSIPGYVADSGSYALIGAAAILGGMSRSTIAATVIVLEACGNNGYILPLMLTFAAARYTGNLFNQSMYDMQIHLKQMPFLEGALKSYGLLNYHPVTEIMSRPAITLQEINLVRDVYQALSTTTHNGFPVVNKEGHLRGFILRKTLCSLLKLRAFSAPLMSVGLVDSGTSGAAGGGAAGAALMSTADAGINARLNNAAAHNININIDDDDIDTSTSSPDHINSENDRDRVRASSSVSSANNSDPDVDVDQSSRGLVSASAFSSTSPSPSMPVSLAPSASMFLETLERHYPNYPTINEVDLTPSEMNHWLDIRSYMDSAPYSINESSSIKRCYRLFRTMGLRHVTVVDGDHRVTGIVTRKDITESRLHEHWQREGESMQKFMNLDTDLGPAVISDHYNYNNNSNNNSNNNNNGNNSGNSSDGDDGSGRGGGQESGNANARGGVSGIDGYLEGSSYSGFGTTAATTSKEGKGSATAGGSGGSGGGFFQRYINTSSQGNSNPASVPGYVAGSTSSPTAGSSPNLQSPLLGRDGGGGGGAVMSSSSSAQQGVDNMGTGGTGVGGAATAATIIAPSKQGSNNNNSSNRRREPKSAKASL